MKNPVAPARVCRTLLITTLLGLPVALAQTPVKTATPAPTTAPALTLSAPVGSTVELSMTTTSSSTITDVQVRAAPGSKVSPAKVEEARRSASQGVGKASQNVTINGKVFCKVAGRDAAGNTTLASTILQNIPAAPGQKAQVMDLQISQVIAPDGKVSDYKLQSNHPVLKAMLSNLTPEKMQQMVDQNGANFTASYGTPLRSGEPRTSTGTLDAQGMLAGVLSALAGPKNQQLFGNVQATPLTVTTTTTYNGQNAQGQHQFSSRSTYGNWKISVASQDSRVPMAITAELLNVDASASSFYAANGLPLGSTTNTRMKMKMTMNMDGLIMSMTMNMNQSVTLKSK